MQSLRPHGRETRSVLNLTGICKALEGCTPAREPVFGFRTLLANLAMIANTRMQLRGGRESLEMLSRPTALRRKALGLLGISLVCAQRIFRCDCLSC